MRLLSGSDLASGRPIWWTGSGWSFHVAEAVDAGERAPAILAVEAAEGRVNGGYAVAAEPTAAGPRPLHIKERIRADGPTIRPDLAVPPTDPADRAWVI